MIALWDFRNGLPAKALRYHTDSVTEFGWRYSQIYYPVEGEERNSLAQSVSSRSRFTMPFAMPGAAVSDVRFSDLIENRHSLSIDAGERPALDDSVVSDLCRLSFGTSASGHRAYPSGGGLYEVNIFIVFDESRYERHGANVALVDSYRNRLLFFDLRSWSADVAPVIAQPELFSRSSALILLSVDTSRIFRKYSDIGYKLVQQETGYIGQNLQLASLALGWGAIPLQAYYDNAAAALVGHDQTVLSAILVG